MLYLDYLLPFAMTVSAAPTPSRLASRLKPFEITEQQPWHAGAVTKFRIHSSCNGSEAHQIRRGLNEAIELAQHAKDHINRWGNSSGIYLKYFGNGAPTTDATGALDIIVNGNKEQSLFRCDDPDGNCVAMPTWGGHYRGENASHETVICPTSFFERRPLSTLCAQGYNVRESSRLIFWASDLLHRLYHLPEFGQGFIDHYAEGYEGIVDAATQNSPNTTHDSDGLQYFALEVYAHDIIIPGEGCPGPSGPASATTSTSIPIADTSTTTAFASASSSMSSTLTITNVTASASPATSGRLLRPTAILWLSEATARTRVSVPSLPRSGPSPPFLREGDSASASLFGRRGRTRSRSVDDPIHDRARAHCTESAEPPVRHSP